MSKDSVEVELSALCHSLNDVNSSSLQITTPAEQLLITLPHPCSLEREAVLFHQRKFESSLHVL